MHDPLVVGRRQRARDLRAVYQRLLDGESAAPQARFKRLALDEFHHEVVGADIVQRADVGMVERSHRSGFAFEAVGERLLRDLDSDLTVQAGIARAEDLAHAALAEQCVDSVRSQPGPRSDHRLRGFVPGLTRAIVRHA